MDTTRFSTIALGVDPQSPHEEARRWADELVQGVGCDLRVVEAPAARSGAALVEASAADDLLVVGSFRSRRGSTVGRLPERLAERSLVPVVIVPDVPRAIEGDVVLAVDEPLDETAVAIAVSEAVRRHRRLTVLRAWEMPVITRTGLTDFAEDPLRWRRINAAVLTRATEEIQARNPDVRVHPLLVEGRPGRAIADHTRLASLVVLGQGHVHVLSGSVLHDVVRETHVPVCVVPPAASGPSASDDDGDGTARDATGGDATDGEADEDLDDGVERAS